MRDFYKLIHQNPFGGNGYFRYDVVYLGGHIPYYPGNFICKKLKDECVFIFSTYLNPKDEKDHGCTYIEIEEEYRISHFASEVLNQTHFHNFTGESNIFEVNEFVTVKKIVSDAGFTIEAEINNQNVYSGSGKVIEKKDRHILLVRQNLKYDNLPILELGSEFDYQIKINSFEDSIFELQACKSTISSFNKDANDDEKAAIEIVSQLLEKKYTELEKIKNEYERKNKISKGVLRG